MAANRIIYFLSLTAAIGFYAASGVWFSWALVFVLLITPVISLLVSLPQMLSLRLSLSAPRCAEQGGRALLQLSIYALKQPPIPNVRLQLCMEYQDGVEFDKRMILQVPRGGGTVWVDAELAGCLQARVRRVRVYDYLGLIGLSRRAPEPTQTSVLPAAKQPKPLPDLSVLRAITLNALPQGTFSELHDYRPYRPGDSVRSIHWKLSLKTDDYIVREPVGPVRLRCCVVVSPVGSMQALGSNLAQLRWAAEFLQSQGLPYTVLWAERDGTRLVRVAQEGDRERMLEEACRMPLFPEAAPQLAVPAADWCLSIRPSREAAP